MLQSDAMCRFFVKSCDYCAMCCSVMPCADFFVKYRFVVGSLLNTTRLQDDVGVFYCSVFTFIAKYKFCLGSVYFAAKMAAAKGLVERK